MNLILNFLIYWKIWGRSLKNKSVGTWLISCKKSKNNLEYKGHPQRIPKPICNPNLFSRSQSWCWTVTEKISQKIKPLWSNLISRKNFLSRKKVKNQIIKVFEMTASICCFSFCLPTCKKSYNTYIQPWHTAGLILGIIFNRGWD